MAHSGTGKSGVALGAITDEFSPDIDIAIAAMVAVGLTAVELRILNGRNVLDANDSEVLHATNLARCHGMEIVSIASPLLKCVLPGAGRLDARFKQDVFASTHDITDQSWLTRRAFAVAHATGARLIRVFSFWRTITPQRAFDRIAVALEELAEQAWKEDLLIGLENEHTCNVGTGVELARMLSEVNHPGLKAVWDPANALIAGESPYPTGYASIPSHRIAHIHAKDCHIVDHKPLWGLLGSMSVDWPGQLQALRRDGYEGAITLETHWAGPDGDKLVASALCANSLRELAATHL